MRKKAQRIIAKRVQLMTIVPQLMTMDLLTVEDSPLHLSQFLIMLYNPPLDN